MIGLLNTDAFSIRCFVINAIPNCTALMVYCELKTLLRWQVDIVSVSVPWSLYLYSINICRFLP